MMAEPKNLLHEADIGSGERSPAQKETDEMIEQIPNPKIHGQMPHHPAQTPRREQAPSQSGNAR